MNIETDLIWMSLVIFVPSIFALGLLFFPKGSEEGMRWWTLVGTAVTFVLSTFVFINYLAMLDFKRDANAGMAEIVRPSPNTSLADRAKKADNDWFQDGKFLKNSDDQLASYPWISKFNINYFIGVDGISMAMILLTTVLFFLSMIASWGIEKHVKGYCMLFLILETGVLGTFFALDFFLFYIFWEVMLLPMYFLIGIWGGPRREYAAIKFFLYTLFGSVFILIALLGFYFTDVQDFVHKGVVDMARDRYPDLKKEVQKLEAPAAKDKGKEKGEPKQLSDEERAAIVTKKQLDLEQKAQVHSFDLLVLARAGMAALQWNRLESDSAREQYIQAIAKTRESDGVKTSAAAVRERFEKQAFFTQTFQIVMFIFLFVGFAIKVPVFPFHTWLPDAHVEAPTPISMILAGILLKLGGYGIIRIAYPLCPWAAHHLAWIICVFAMINIVYGAFAAMAQTDFKKLVAYSSISHMGYVILGIAVWQDIASQYWVWGMNGAMYQMIAHGISSAGMFFCVGVIYDRAHHRNLDNFRGLNEPMPLYGGISAIIFFAALGLPGLCGFVGEFFVILSTWNFSTPDFPNAGKVFAVLAALTVVITAAYILWTLQRVYLGTNPAYKDYKDITLRELLCAIPLVVLAVVLGIFPMLVLQWMEPHVTGLVDTLVQAKM